MQHDEYKPLTMTFTDSLGELGNLDLKWLSECVPRLCLPSRRQRHRTFNPVHARSHMECLLGPGPLSGSAG